jgi:RNA polymerase sigma factor (sigma-70 family)
MSRRFINPVHHFLGSLAGRRAGGDATDELLLRRFAAGRDEAAFTALLQRHGPLVLGVCRRVLGDAHDAEDAFQATFLVLARQAATGFRPRALAGWLHGVACRTALRARKQAAKRRARERQAARTAACEPSAEVLWADVRRVLDEEIGGLPEKYRAPFVLCYLQGKTNVEAAEELGCPRGTVLSRLATARERLRARLERRGITLSVAALMALLAEELAAAALPRGLAAAAVRVALATPAGATPLPASSTVETLAAGALQATGWMKARAAALVLLLAGVLALGGALYASHSGTPPPEEAAQQGPPPQGKPKQDERPAEQVLSVVYNVDIGDIVAKWSFWDLDRVLSIRPTNPGGHEGAGEGLTRSLLESLITGNPALARKFVGKDAPYSLQLLNRKQLEVRADRKTHEQVKELVAAFRRSLDLAVVVESWLYEVGREVYEKQIAGKLPRHPGNPPVFVDPATDETERKLLEGKGGRKGWWFDGLKPLRHNKVTIQDRKQVEFFSWRTAVPYERSPARVFQKKELAIAYPGFSFSMTPAIGSDRRRTHIKLTQKVTQLVEWQKVKAEQLLPNQDTKEVTFEVPVVQDSSLTSTFAALDGWPVVVPVQWRPGAEGKDRVLVLLFTARILIEEEERQIRKGLEEQKKKQ